MKLAALVLPIILSYNLSGSEAKKARDQERDQIISKQVLAIMRDNKPYEPSKAILELARAIDFKPDQYDGDGHFFEEHGINKLRGGFKLKKEDGPLGISGTSVIRIASRISLQEEYWLEERDTIRAAKAIETSYSVFRSPSYIKSWIGQTFSDQFTKCHLTGVTDGSHETFDKKSGEFKITARKYRHIDCVSEFPREEFFK